jgi:hypothetical protein
MTATRFERPPVRRVALLLLGGVSLLAGLLGALVLLGVPMPQATVGLGARHGLLLTLGFLGTLIALERAVALGRPWGYLAPLAAGLAGPAMIHGAPTPIVGGLLTVAAVVYVALYVAFDRIEVALHTRIQAVGAVAWLGAGLLVIAGRPTATIVPWLAAFLVLTIAGERLELSRLRRPTVRARRLFIAIVAIFALGVLLTLIIPDVGWRLAGLGLLGLAGWLAINDIARRTVRTPGVTRFVAVALLAGYGWLAVSGIIWLAFGPDLPAAAYDVLLHALFLGFVISMVFGHAPVILPAVIRTPLPYHPIFYVHLGLLHAGLLLRIVAGDLAGIEAAWRAGGVLNVAALVLFIVVSASSALRARRRGAGPMLVPAV